MRAPVETSKVLDRGGNPTVRELLSSIVFNPSNGMISLNGDRIVMQRTSVSMELRRELVRMLGSQEARIFLIRLGFLSGQADARFVRASWPNLNARDAFTAGTRLHTFSGVVRVETVFNTYDFGKKKLTAEFLWHDSVEAADFRANRPSADPVCWTQLGYASGYASEFFDTLIVYKELECAGQGHSHCRVIGKHADAWGASDPEVVMFRNRIIAEPVPATAGPSRRNSHRPADQSLSDLDRALLAPVRPQLDRLATIALPVLLSGAPGTGRSRAAHYLHHASGASTQDVLAVFGQQVTLELCAEIARPAKSGKKNPGPGMILIDGVQDIAADIQPHLARAIEAGILCGGPRIVALAAEDRPARPAGLLPELRSALSALSVRMPSFAERTGERAAIARGLVPMLAARMGREPVALDEAATRHVEDHAWPGNLQEMRSILTGAMIEHSGSGPITGRDIETRLSRHAVASLTTGAAGVSMTPLLEKAMEGQAFSLPDFERSAYKAALDRAGGNMSAAARLLGLSRAQLAYRVSGQNDTKPDRETAT